ncbi:hypothetical protein [Sphingomonas baiyangensis]|uniref:GTPase n=1 Tax=Sphingomonas baiyangensis TaxID=2572576 RepID=A0A4U1L0H6_9SPHN|nr:hypothetical protein [Sphingomonas baiyangensis]TKD50102.1 hypothetical protein FBR43_04515 [Sphingomonas baiyangensis]
MSAARLMFVYNADDGLAAALLDAAHKLVSPATYPCSLCAVTYGAVAMRRDWRAFLRRLAAPPRFYHRQKFERDHPDVAEPLPLVLIEREAHVSTLIDARTLASIRDVPALVAMIESRAPDAVEAPGEG